MADSDLKLDYEFTTTPYPIRASPEDGLPNRVTVAVMVSNPESEPVPIESITIRIPAGENTQDKLSSKTLPAPDYDRSSPWSIDNGPDYLKLTSADDELKDVIVFTLKDIEVNSKQGIVPIKIIETYPDSNPNTDSRSYTLVKHESDFPIKNFFASPTTLDDINKPVTLHWDCSQEGEHYTYNLRPYDLLPKKDCMDSGDCYTCADGQRGVKSKPLNKTTEFFLEVIKADSAGGRSVYKTLETKVRLEVPSVSPLSHLKQLFSGPIVNMHWFASNTARCSVQIDGNTIDEHAPADTYSSAYTVVLPGEPGKRQLSITAHSQREEGRGSEVPHAFPDLTFRNSSTIALTDRVALTAISPDSKIAVAVLDNSKQPGVVFIDLEKRQVAGTMTAPISDPSDVVVSRDSRTAIVSGSHGLVFLDIATRKLESLLLGNFTCNLAMTRDRRRAVVYNRYAELAFIVDIDTRKYAARVVGIDRAVDTSITITPDDRFALMLRANVAEDTTVFVVDLLKQQIDSKIEKPGTILSKSKFIFTPDGKFALASNLLGFEVIDLDKRAFDPAFRFQLVATPLSIPVTPDGRFALLGATGGVEMVDIIERQSVAVFPHDHANKSQIFMTPDGDFGITLKDDQSSKVGVLNISGRKIVGDGISVPALPQKVAISPDGRTGVIVCQVRGKPGSQLVIM